MYENPLWKLNPQALKDRIIDALIYMGASPDDPDFSVKVARAIRLVARNHALYTSALDPDADQLMPGKGPSGEPELGWYASDNTHAREDDYVNQIKALLSDDLEPNPGSWAAKNYKAALNKKPSRTIIDALQGVM